MKIRELTVQNYRGFAGAKTFPVSDQFTVVAGVNGRGKTALLDGLALLLSRFLRSLHLTSGDLRTITRSEIHGRGAVDVVIASKLLCGEIPVNYQVELKNGRANVVATRISNALRDEIVKGYGDPRSSNDQLPIAVYYTTDRAGFRLPKTLPSKLPEGQELAYSGALFNRMVDYRDFMGRFRVWRRTRSSPALRAFNSALSEFLEGFGEVEVSGTPPRLTIRKGVHRLELDQLSDGERAFLALVADIVRRLALANPKLENPLQGFGIVLIDELELHLHPQWQREVVEKLRRTFPNLQFIATTHSPFIIQTIRGNELILLDDMPTGTFENRGIEEIAVKVMGIDDPSVTPRYSAMLNAARNYFAALEQPGALTPAKRTSLKRKLNRLARPYADNPAFQAFLEMQRVRAMKE